MPKGNGEPTTAAAAVGSAAARPTWATIVIVGATAIQVRNRRRDTPGSTGPGSTTSIVSATARSESSGATDAPRSLIDIWNPPQPHRPPIGNGCYQNSPRWQRAGAAAESAGPLA